MSKYIKVQIENSPRVNKWEYDSESCKLAQVITGKH